MSRFTSSIVDKLGGYQFDWWPFFIGKLNRGALSNFKVSAVR